MTPASLSILQHLTEARDLAQRLLGDRYAEEIAPLRKIIRRWAAESPRPLAEVCKTLLEAVDEHGSAGDMLCAQAACYEEMAGKSTNGQTGGGE